MMKRLAIGVLAAVGLGVVIGAASLLLFPAKPYVSDLPQGEADSLWLRCDAAITAKAFSAGDQGNWKHPRLDLHVYNGVHLTPFRDYFNTAPVLVGMIENKNTNPSGDDIGSKWKTMPPGQTCIFMGGDQTALFARVVWWSKAGAQAQGKGKKRRVAARFDEEHAHVVDGAKWDNPVDTRMTDATNSSAPKMPRRLIHAHFDDGSLWETLTAFIAGDSGAWFTCSQYTCCKAK
ncbi:MAG: hypothetical protein SGJ01_18820 [Gemmatimonadota bacterium]|nr:hypothetical protein [Gemmatimonadota bacterium]